MHRSEFRILQIFVKLFWSFCCIFWKKYRKNCEKKRKIAKFSEVWSGAKECKSCRSRKMLKNDALVAKFGVDTAENEPSKVWWFGWEKGSISNFSTKVPPAEPVVDTAEPAGCSSPTSTLVERFDIEPFSDFTTKWSNFRGLVLGCIDSYDSNQIVILQGFSRSTRFAILCTAQISKFQQKFVKLFSNFCLNLCKIASFQHFFIEFCTDSDENFSEFCWIY